MGYWDFKIITSDSWLWKSVESELEWFKTDVVYARYQYKKISYYTILYTVINCVYNQLYAINCVQSCVVQSSDDLNNLIARVVNLNWIGQRPTLFDCLLEIFCRCRLFQQISVDWNRHIGPRCRRWVELTYLHGPSQSSIGGVFEVSTPGIDKAFSWIAFEFHPVLLNSEILERNWELGLVVWKRLSQLIFYSDILINQIALPIIKTGTRDR